MSPRGARLSAIARDRDGVRVATFQPVPRLVEHVDCYWTLEVDAARLPVTVRALPDARVDLVFDLTAPPARAYLAGPRETPTAYEHTRPTRLLGATLVPSSLDRLFGVSPADLTPDWTPVEDLAGAASARLATEIEALPSLDERLAFLDTFLSSRLAHGHGHAAVDGRLARAVDAVETAEGRVDVERLAELARSSPRHLARLFHKWMGIGPKRFARIVRAQAAVRRIGTAGASLAQVAMELGYADQAHLTRELRALFGAAPRDLSNEVRK
jgi:AraC-like DNA-binding protein